MKEGNWVPIDKRLSRYLPIKRSYTELEAMFSYSKDIDENKEKAVREYARIWQWSRTKVDNFMQKIKASKEPEESQQRASKEPEYRFVFNSLEATKSQKKASKEPEESQKKATTINPNPKDFLCEEIIADLNAKGGFRFTVSEGTKKLINGRVSDGFKKEDFFHVHNAKIAEWKNNPKMSKFLRPKTLYLPDNFQSYLNQKSILTKRIQNADGDFIEVPV